MISVSHSSMVYLVKLPRGFTFGPSLYGVRYDSKHIGLMEVYLN